jgi:hypothetical protein
MTEDLREDQIEVEGAIVSVSAEDPDELPVHPLEVGELPPEELVALANTLLRERHDRVATMKEDEAAMRMELQRVREGWGMQIGLHEDAIAKLEATLQAIAGRLDFHGKKSRSLPEGRIGYRTVPAKLDVVDEATVVEWVRSTVPSISLHTILIPQEPKLSKRGLLAYFRMTGELPAGCEPIPEEERFYVQD